MPQRKRQHKPNSLRVNRLHAARKIGPLISRESLRELPWVFRIPAMILGLFALACVVIFAILPLIAIVAGLFG